MAETLSERPPYVEFKMVEVEDRPATIAKGCYQTKQVPFAFVTRPPGKDTLEKNALDWLNDLKAGIRNGSAPANWYDHFKARYDQWLAGESGPVNGTPIKGWMGLSPGAQAAIIKAGILSIEDLANTPDQELTEIGMGAVGYKQKAIAWLKEAAGPGKVAEEMAALRQQMADMQALLKTQGEELLAYKAREAIAEAAKK